MLYSKLCYVIYIVCVIDSEMPNYLNKLRLSLSLNHNFKHKRKTLVITSRVIKRLSYETLVTVQISNRRAN